MKNRLLIDDACCQFAAATQVIGRHVGCKFRTCPRTGLHNHQGFAKSQGIVRTDCPNNTN